MTILKSHCDDRKNCIHRDSTLCNNCSRSKWQRSDYFEQNNEQIKEMFTKELRNITNKTHLNT